MVKEIKYDCLVYFKRREDRELQAVIKFLESKGFSYNIVSYNNYSENDFYRLANESRFCFLVNGTESQGIAVQEIMSMNVPIIAWDIKSWEDQGEPWSVPATSIPYWSDLCGEKFYYEDEINLKFEQFYSNLNTYNPAKYIEKELSYKASIQKLTEILNDN